MCMCVYIYIHVSISLSLSLYIYIHIRIHICILQPQETASQFWAREQHIVTPRLSAAPAAAALAVQVQGSYGRGAKGDLVAGHRVLGRRRARGDM